VLSLLQKMENSALISKIQNFVTTSKIKNSAPPQKYNNPSSKIEKSFSKYKKPTNLKNIKMAPKTKNSFAIMKIWIPKNRNQNCVFKVQKPLFLIHFLKRAKKVSPGYVFQSFVHLQNSELLVFFKKSTRHLNY